MIRPEVFEWVAAELSEAALRMKKDGLYPADIDYIMSHVTAEIRAQELIAASRIPLDPGIHIEQLRKASDNSAAGTRSEPRSRLKQLIVL